MRLEKKREEELARRKGLTGRTIIQLVWLAISFAVAYIAANYVFAQGWISYSSFYSVGLPRSVPTWVILGGIMLFIVFVMQFFLILGFMLAEPEGRRKLGDPSLHSRSKDPFDQPYQH